MWSRHSKTCCLLLSKHTSGNAASPLGYRKGLQKHLIERGALGLVFKKHLHSERAFVPFSICLHTEGITEVPSS